MMIILQRKNVVPGHFAVFPLLLILPIITVLLLQLGQTSGLLLQNSISSLFAGRSILSFQKQATPYDWDTELELLDGEEDDHHQTPYNWDEQFEELQSFKSEFEHCNFPQNPSKELEQKYPMLKRFCHDQRREYKLLQWNKKKKSNSMTLPVFDRFIRWRQLEELGFEFNQEWYEKYSELQQYASDNGHCMMENKGATKSLYVWAKDQRRRRTGSKKGSPALTDKQIRLLDAIEFPWESHANDAKWHLMYDELRGFQKKHGHCQPGKLKHPRLYNWSNRQRGRHQGGVLPTERVELLEKIGFSFESNQVLWSTMLDKLIDYSFTHGHLRVSEDDDPDLYEWMNIQRERYHGIAQPTLSDIQIEKLEEANFCWSLDWNERTWHEKYTETVEFFKEHGHVRVTKKGNPSLYNWIQRQEKRYKEVKGQKPLLEAELEMLEQINFPFFDGQNRMAWNAMYDEVTKYRVENDGRFPISHKDDPDLHRWLGQQRHRYRCAYGYPGLSDEQKSLLESVDFPIYPSGKQRRSWYEKYDELVSFWKHHGNFLLDQNGNRPLYNWMMTQRERFHGTSSYRGKTLSKLEVYLLDRIGFAWTSDRNEVVWQMNYREVVKFLSIVGHFPSFSEHLKLHSWIAAQQQRYNGRGACAELSESQIHQLKIIGILEDSSSTTPAGSY